jgi:hypothetical protein
MAPNLIAAAASVIVIVITVIGQWISSRNDRNLTNQEADLLQKLDSHSSAARELSEVIELRISRWRRRMTAWSRTRRFSLWLFQVGGVLVLVVYPFVFPSEQTTLLLYVFYIGLTFMWSGVIWLVYSVFERRREEQRAARSKASV